VRMDFPADPPVASTDEVARALPGVTVGEVLRGRWDLLVLARDAAEVRAMQPDLDVMAGWEARCVIVTAPGDKLGTDFVTRVIWLVLCGLWMALGYVVAGIICCILIITIPFGIASFRIANYALWPFGRTVVDRRDAGVGSLVGNVVWIIFAGWWLAIGHLVTG